MNLKSKKQAALAGLAFACLLPLSAKAETTIFYNLFTPPSHFSWEVMKDWAKQVNEKSEGRLKIEFAAKSVAPPPKVMNAVRKGAADAGFVANILAQFPKCMHGLLIAAASQARGDALPTMPMRWNHRR